MASDINRDSSGKIIDGAKIPILSFNRPAGEGANQHC